MNRIVLIGALPPPVAGQSIAFKLFYDYLQKKNIAHLLIDIGGESAGRKDGGFTFNRFFSFIRPFTKSLCLLNLFKKDICYLHIAQSKMGFFRDLVFVLIAWLGRNKIVVHLHGGNYNNFYYQQNHFLRFLIRWVLNRSDKIIVLSENLRNMFAFSESLNSKLYVVENGINTPAGYPPVNKKLELQTAPINILYLSNMIESKGYLDLLYAGQEIKKKGLLNFKIIFCGKFYLSSNSKYSSEDEAVKDFYSLVDSLSLRNHVIWKKQVVGDEKWQEIKNSHFFVLPTYYNNEGQPLSVIEAISQGCCVLATNYRAIPDLINQGKAGVFVDKKSPEDIASKVIDLLNNKDTFAEISREAVKHYEKNYTADRHLQKLYGTLLS